VELQAITDIEVGGYPAIRIDLTTNARCGGFGDVPIWQGAGGDRFSVPDGGVASVFIIDVDGDRLVITTRVTPKSGMDTVALEAIVASIIIVDVGPTLEAIATVCAAADDAYKSESPPPAGGPIDGASVEWIVEDSERIVRIADDALARLRALDVPQFDRDRLSTLIAHLEPPIDIYREIPSAVATGDTARIVRLLWARVDRTHTKDGLVVSPTEDPYGLWRHLKECPIQLPA
jgi:hypothetical protein